MRNTHFNDAVRDAQRAAEAQGTHVQLKTNFTTGMFDVSVVGGTNEERAALEAELARRGVFPAVSLTWDRDYFEDSLRGVEREV